MPTPGWQLQKKWRCAFVPLVFVCVLCILCSGMWNIDLKQNKNKTKQKKKSDLPTLFFFSMLRQSNNFFLGLSKLQINLPFKISDWSFHFTTTFLMQCLIKHNISKKALDHHSNKCWFLINQVLLLAVIIKRDRWNKSILSSFMCHSHVS